MFINLVSRMRKTNFDIQQFDYYILDSNFEYRLDCSYISTNGLWWDAVIECYESLNLDVSKNLINYIANELIHYTGDNSIDVVLQKHSTESIKLNKYFDEIKKLLLLA